MRIRDASLLAAAAATAALLLLPVPAHSTEPAPPVDVVLPSGTLAGPDSRGPEFEGLGVQVTPYPNYEPSEAQWRLAFARLDVIRPSLIHTMLSADWYACGFDRNGQPEFDWTTPRMERLYRVLDWARSRHVAVTIGEWGDPTGYYDNCLSRYGIRAGDPRWSTLVGGFLHQLYDVDGYHDIRYYNLLNEPNGSWSGNKDFASWKAAVLSLHAELRRRGLADRVAIIGPGSVWADDWLYRTIDELHTQVGAFDVHHYDRVTDVQHGDLEQELIANRRFLTDRLDSRAPLLLSEAGIADHKDHDSQPLRYSFDYGIWLADMAVQAIDAGAQGIVAYDLDDAMSRGGGYGSMNLKGWGMWNSLGGTAGYPPQDVEVRPWFSAWTLMSHAFPEGAFPLPAPATGVPGLRVALATADRADRNGLSIAVVHDAPGSITVHLALPPAFTRTSLREYRYFRDSTRQDSDGNPVAARTLPPAALTAGVDLALPGPGLVVLSADTPRPPSSP